MKSIKIIIAVALSLQMGVLFAGNESLRAPATEVITSVNFLSLIPSIPSETTLEDTNIDLSPVTPGAESSYEMVSLMEIAPVIPSEVDITDLTEETTFDLNLLLPVVPAEVDFE